MALSGVILEVVRYSGMKNVILEAQKNAAHSVLSNYNQKLWENYKIYGLNIEYPVIQNTKRYIENGIGNEEWIQGIDFYQGEVCQTSILENKRITDHEGEDFYLQALRYEKIHLPKVLLSKWIDALKKQHKEAESISEKEILDSSKDAVSKVENGKWEEEKGEPVSSKEAEEYKELKNPVKEYCSRMGMSLTQQVVEDTSKVSHSELPSGKVQSWDVMEKGNIQASNSSEGTTVDQLLFCSYLSEHFSYLTNIKDKRDFQYQLEYILTGREKEDEALEDTLQKMKWLRMGVNYLYLLTSTTQSQKAMAYAVALVGFTGIQPIIEAVKLGILFVWSYVETIKELKCLAAGKRIPLIKTDQNFRSDLKHLFDQNEKVSWDQDQSTLLGYKEFIEIFLFFEDSGKQKLRAIHCMNLDLFGREGKRSLDQFYSQLELKVTTEFSNIFEVLNSKNQQRKFPRVYERKYKIGYLQ